MKLDYALMLNIVLKKMKKCHNDEKNHYCLNHDFGCIESSYDDCLECGKILDFDKCTKCKEGYELGNYDLCYEIENNE